MSDDLITAEWLASVGFKWHQLERQPEKHWLLWLASAYDRHGPELCGVELAPWTERGVILDWHCWFRSDLAGRYSRFLFIRSLRTQQELIRLIEGVTDLAWHPDDNLYGSMHTPAQAAMLRREAERLDRKWLQQNPPWRNCETDPTQGGALPEHLEHVMRCKADETPPN